MDLVELLKLFDRFLGKNEPFINTRFFIYSIEREHLSFAKIEIDTRPLP